jgi:hypothetical protein
MFGQSIRETEKHVFTKVGKNSLHIKDEDKSICFGKNKGAQQPGML